MATDCLFCSIVAGDVPADIVRTDERTVAFRDINPQAPVHVLVVPVRHIVNAATSAADDADDVAAMLVAAKAVADAEGIGGDDRGYRLVFNVGPDASTPCPTSTSTCSAGGPSTGPGLRRPSRRPAGWPPRPATDRTARPAGRVGARTHVAGTPVKILVPGNHLMAGLLGQRDELLRLIEGAFADVQHRRAGQRDLHRGGGRRAGRCAVRGADHPARVGPGPRRRAGQADHRHDARRRPALRGPDRELLRSARGRAVRPKTGGQKAYADAIAPNIVTFGIGPAGTGKSYLAVALAVQALQAHQVSRIILTRPAVEAGERLGSCPAT